MIQNVSSKKKQEEESEVWQGCGVVALAENGPRQVINIVPSPSVSKDTYSCIHLQNDAALSLRSTLYVC